MMPWMASTTMWTQMSIVVHMCRKHSTSCLWLHCWDRGALFTANCQIYCDIWEAAVGQMLLCQQETGSPHSVISYPDPTTCFNGQVSQPSTAWGKVRYAIVHYMTTYYHSVLLPSLTCLLMLTPDRRAYNHWPSFASTNCHLQPVFVKEWHYLMQSYWPSMPLLCLPNV